MPAPAPGRGGARTLLSTTVTVLLSLALVGGMQFSASAAPLNPLVPEATAVEPPPAAGSMAGRVAQIQPTEQPTSLAEAKAAAPIPAAKVVKPKTSSSFRGFAFPGCAGSGPATVAAAVHSKKTRTVDWVLSGAGFKKSGELRVQGTTAVEKATEFSVTGLTTGKYQLDLRKNGSSKVSVRVPILVLGCVQAQATCKGITFTNPATNPLVSLDYGPADEESDADGGFFSLAPGQSRSVRTDELQVVYSAYGFSKHTESSAADKVGLTIPQACNPPTPEPGDHSLISFGFADCVKPAAPAVMELEFERLKDIAVRFEIRDAANAVVLAGTADANSQVTGKLSRSGSYRYLSYVNGSTTAYENVKFRVYDCVQVQRTCKKIIITNPNPVRIEVDYSTPPGKHARHRSLAAGASKKVSWTYKTLSWFAYSPEMRRVYDELAPRVFSIAGEQEDVPRPTC